MRPVVVAVHDEGLDAGLREAAQPVVEGELRVDAAVGSVVDVAPDQDEVDGVLDRGVDQVLVGPEGRALEEVA